MKQLAVFASGSGTNAENLIRYFAASDVARVSFVLYNRADAPVRLRAARLGVDAVYADRSRLADSAFMLPLLRTYHVDFIVLAGFLSLVPSWLLDRYPGRVVNIHPSLLPLHGGKGMYGQHVHRAVLAAGEAESGITIHRIDAVYDRGEVLFQARCPVLPGDTPEQLAARVHALEYRYFPLVVERLCTGGDLSGLSVEPNLTDTYDTE